MYLTRSLSTLPLPTLREALRVHQSLMGETTAGAHGGNHGALCADAGSAPAPPQDRAGSPLRVYASLCPLWFVYLKPSLLNQKLITVRDAIAHAPHTIKLRYQQLAPCNPSAIAPSKTSPAFLEGKAATKPSVLHLHD